MSKHCRMPFVLFVLSMVCGCFPASYTYWSPSAQGGRLYYSAVGSIAPSNAIEYTYDGVRISLSGNGTGVGMTVDIPKGKAVSFTSDVAVICLPEPQKVVFDVATVDEKSLAWQHFSPTSTMSNTHYLADIRFGETESLLYRIKVPPIRIDDKRYDIPEIQFTKKKGFGVFGP